MTASGFVLITTNKKCGTCRFATDLNADGMQSIRVCACHQGEVWHPGGWLFERSRPVLSKYDPATPCPDREPPNLDAEVSKLAASLKEAIGE